MNIYGTDETEAYARSPWDNVGVQYGLEALRAGSITPEQFLDWCANVGSWKASRRTWCRRAARTSRRRAPARRTSTSGARGTYSSRPTAAPRRLRGVGATGKAGYAAYRSRWSSGQARHPGDRLARHYLEHRLDAQLAPVVRRAATLLNHDGDASNQLIWFTDARPGTPQSDQTPQAFLVLDEWIKTGQKPATASDACFATNGTLIASGPDVWDRILNDEPAGACETFPLYSTSRIVAGGPIEGGVFKCTVQPVERAVARGVYRSWEPTAAEVDRLDAIFRRACAATRSPIRCCRPGSPAARTGRK